MQIFVNKYLRQDGVLIVKLLTSATSTFFGHEICNALFRHFLCLHQPTVRDAKNNGMGVENMHHIHFVNQGFGRESESVSNKKLFLKGCGDALDEEVDSGAKNFHGDLNRWFEHERSEKTISPLEHHDTSGVTENVSAILVN